jgi:TorA maturation chaperone TorD
MQEPESNVSFERLVDEINHARAQEYALLATLLSRSPDTELIGRMALLRADVGPVGAAHAALGEAARGANEDDLAREYFDLFAGLGDSSLLPYSSHYLAGALYGRPLVRLRESLRHLGIEKVAGHSEPEDHAAILCEIMAGLVSGGFAAAAGADRDFFERYLAPWIGRFFADLENAKAARFYARVGSLGRTFVEVEEAAFSLSD